MAIELKPVERQVACIIGASSGIGRETALRFAARGAKLIVSARGKSGLATLVDEIKREGGEAIAVSANVLEFDQVKRIADAAIESYGRLDTWVHAAAVSIYAKFEQTTPEEFKQIIDTNLTGQAYGAIAALPHIKREGRGALIHISSVEARRSLPYQSAYAASKHGIKGFLEALRMELERDEINISVTEIMPSGINTPFFNKARTKLGVKPMPVQPIYQPSHVADAILYAAENPTREIIVGGGGKMLELTERFSPRIADKVLSLISFEGQKTNESKSETGPDNLFQSLEAHEVVEGDFTDRSRQTSVYTWMQTHPRVKQGLTAAAIGFAAMLTARTLANRSNSISFDKSGFEKHKGRKI